MKNIWIGDWEFGPIPKKKFIKPIQNNNLIYLILNKYISKYFNED